MIKRLLIIGLLLVTDLLSNETAQVPEELAFQVGSISVSQYIYDREYGKALRASGGEISNEEKEEWLSGWIAKLKIVNRAIDEGYSQRPEVHRAVSIMSRYMMIHGTDSPYFRIVIDPLLGSPPDKSGIERLRSRKLAEVKQQLHQQLEVEVYPAAEESVLRNLDSLMRINEYPDYGQVFQGIIAVPFFKYSFGNSAPKEVTVEGFFSEYETKVMKEPINGPEGLRREIGAFLVDSFLYDQAVDMKLHEDGRFQLEAKNYTWTVIYETYTKRPLSDPSTEEDLRRYYKANLEEYERTASISVWMIESEDLAALQSLRKKVLNIKAHQQNAERFLSVFEDEADALGFRKNPWNRSNAPPNLLDAPNGWMPPIDQKEGKYRLIVKRLDLDTEIPSFESIEEEVEQDFKAAEYRMRTKRELLSLGKRYEVSFGAGFHGKLDPETAR